MLTGEEDAGGVGDFEESGEGRSLVVGPVVLADAVVEGRVVVGTAAHVDDEVVVLVVLVEVGSHVLDRVPIGLLEEVGRRVRHRDYAGGYVRQVQLLPVVRRLLLRPSHDFPHQRFHQRMLLLTPPPRHPLFQGACSIRRSRQIKRRSQLYRGISPSFRGYN